MLVGGIEYLYAFDGKKCTAVYDINPLSPYSYVKKIRADRDGRIWVACYDALNRYNLCVFTPDDLVPYNIPYGKANNIETDKNGCLWIATNFDGNTWTTYNCNNSPLPSDCFWDVQVDADNRLWIATAGDVGLVCFDPIFPRSSTTCRADSPSPRRTASTSIMARKTSSKKIYEENQAVDTGVDDGVLQSSA